ncbi:response regulator [Phormidium sp. LEGE 05292]|uniref:response regulator n=1 Tax=[Phormidium] sp. LEGE 05292 TaxID=767427 RepID=UPI00187F03B6|nr:response regulator [Phormidium sp. LEGE 05292]MBE9229582.1 response regulator [Phormidium sp. LEGE 05292]
MKIHARLLTILLVEDSKSDAVLIQETLSESKFLNELHLVRDGVEATDFLYKRGKYANAPRPDLILLDLNLPKKNGRELLAQIKADEKLKTIPVVILTTSSNEADILKSYQLHVNCYLVKPVGLEQFVEVVKSIENFWLAFVELPPE